VVTWPQTWSEAKERTMMKIVVGTDGSPNATSALRWAVEEADVHQADIEVVLVWSYFDQHHPDRSDTFDPHYTEDTARAALALWVTEALGARAPVEQRTVLDLPARALLQASDVAELLVLGARGNGGFEGLLLGSVVGRVAQLAPRPIAVVRTMAPVRGGRVVVGVDGSARSVDALRWAASEARARDADLDVVHAWRVPTMPASLLMSASRDFDSMADTGRAVLDTALADPALTGTRVRPHSSNDSPARALVERAAGAGVVVVGTRGLGRVTGALLGSVSRQLLNHAPCPVVVI
jgi:nucleotide-binding universal stress UspA family protein